MREKKKHVVILCYSFPPNAGVGGRRWAKFGKYLNRIGYTVEALTVKPNKGDNKSSYVLDVKQLKVNYYGNKSPTYLSGYTTNVFEKVAYRFILWYRSMVIKGTPFDLAGLDTNKIIKALSKIHLQRKIDVLIATGAPFHLLFAAALFKQKYPSINLISDFRDPWISGGNYGIKQLSSEKLAAEVLKEKSVMSYSDTVLVPVQSMQQDLSTKYNLYAHKIKVLAHGYDKDFVKQKNNHCIDPNNIRLVYFGTIYEGCEQHLVFLKELLFKAEGKLQITHFGKLTNEHLNILHPIIELGFFISKPALPENELFEQLVTFDFAILFKRMNYGLDHLSTKYHEIIASKIPVFFIGGAGGASDFISGNNLGLCVNRFDIDIDDVLLNLKEFRLNTDFVNDELAYNELTKQLEKLFVL